MMELIKCKEESELIYMSAYATLLTLLAIECRRYCNKKEEMEEEAAA